MPSLLAVDLGLRLGLALYRGDGRLVWYRSQHLANRSSLRRAARGWLAELPDLAHLIIEGGGPLALIWCQEAQRRGVPAQTIAAESWRSALLTPRQRTDRARSKGSAEILARQVIEWSGAPRPTSLRHDAAEAIALGLHGVLQLGWLSTWPPRP